MTSLIARWQTYNSLNQPPCQTAAYLAAECSNGRTFLCPAYLVGAPIDAFAEFNIEPLPQGRFYAGPSGSDNCRCNSVYYSLISGCAGCQKGIWQPYVHILLLSVSCLILGDPYSTVTTSGTQTAPVSLPCQRSCLSCSQPHGLLNRFSWSRFPQSITNDTRVPAWAFMNVSVRHCSSFSHRPAFFSTSTLTSQITQKWDNVSACAKGRDPESTGTFRPSFAPKFDDGDAVRVGVIVGAATACTVLAFALVATGIWCFVRRRRQRRQFSGPDERSSSAMYPTEQENSPYSAEPWTPDTDKRFYVRAPHSLSFLRLEELIVTVCPPATPYCPCDARIPRTLVHIPILDLYRTAP